MKVLQWDSSPQFITNELYRIPNVAFELSDNNYYYFQSGPVKANFLYGTCIGNYNNSDYWYFERYPDKTKVYMSSHSAKLAVRYGIYEYESEDEMIVYRIK